MCPHVTHAYLDPPEPTTQTGFRSVQPFLLSSWQSVVEHAWSRLFQLKITPSHGDLDSRLIHASFGPPKSITQMAFRSFQPFLNSSWQTVPILRRALLFPKIAPSRGGSGPPSNILFLGLTEVLNPNSISISSAVFAGLTTVTDRLTDRPTDHVTQSVTIDRIYLHSTNNAA